ncbi:MAG TPA: CoA transferase [Candidatus Binataceae bacterium]|nr:CoA transferase [Candidatus Binataceae bacterium]
MTAQSDSNDIFAGVRVIEIGQYIAAPVAARMMSDMGAEVFKVELPPRGDMMRVYAAPGLGPGTPFIGENRGKKSVCIDLKRPEGIEVLRDLVKHSDVLVENYTPGVLAKYGVRYEEFKPLNPRLIMCSISGFGQTGPLASKPGNDLIGQAMSGFLNLVGYPDRPPAYPGANLADNGAGIHALAAIASALYFREKTGRGQYIDLSLVECLGHYNSMGVVMHAISGGRAKQTRSGSHSPGTAPFGVFKARDGYVVLSVLINQWGTFTELMGKPELASDPRYDTVEHRLQHQGEVNAMVEQWLQSFESRDQPLAMLDQVHIMCAPVLDTAGFVNDSQIAARGLIQQVEQPGVGTVGIPRAPFHYSDARVEIRMRAPMLGEHNEAALSAVLGYAKEKIAALNQSGVLQHDPQLDQLRASGELV